MTRTELRDYLVRKFNLSPQDLHKADEAMAVIDSYVSAELLAELRMTDPTEDLRLQVVEALCTDHGHIDRPGALSCRTCNRRADIVIPLVERLVRERIAADIEADSILPEGTIFTRPGVSVYKRCADIARGGAA